jgi:hypothetical protein
MKQKNKSQVEYGPDTPNYAVLNAMAQHQTNAPKGVVVKPRAPKKGVKSTDAKPT